MNKQSLFQTTCRASPFIRHMKTLDFHKPTTIRTWGVLLNYRFDRSNNKFESLVEQGCTHLSRRNCIFNRKLA